MEKFARMYRVVPSVPLRWQSVGLHRKTLAHKVIRGIGVVHYQDHLLLSITTDIGGTWQYRYAESIRLRRLKGVSVATPAEQLLISSILRDKDFDLAVKHGIQAEHMHIFKAEWIWLEKYLTGYHKSPTKAAFRHQFPEFSIKAVNDTGYYSTAVKQEHAKRALTKGLSSIANSIGEGDIDSAITQMQGSIVHVAAGMGASMDDSDILMSFDDTFDAVSERVMRAAKYGNAGVPTGFSTFDKAVGGLMPSYLTVVGARLGEGKSQTLARMAVEAAVNGFSVMYVSLEQPRSEISMRLHGYLSQTVGPSTYNSIDLNQGKNIDLEEYGAFLRSLRDKVSGKLHVVDSSTGPMSTNDVSVLVSRNKPDIVLVDYITLLKQEGDWQAVGKAAADLKNIASEAQCSVVTAAQLNRTHGIMGGEKDTGGKDMPAGAEALAQSDGIGQAADVVVTLRKISTSVSTMKLAKHRHGISGQTWYNEFRPGRGIFQEVSKQRAEELRMRDDERSDAMGDAV